MAVVRLFAPILAALLSSACSDGGRSGGSTPAGESAPSLEPTFSAAPIDLPGIAVDFAADLRYGESERNVLDIYLPDCADPTPLVIYIHGGGFRGGDKAGAHENFDHHIREFLQNCIAYATVNYSLLEVPEDAADLAQAAEQGGILTSLRDSARALQFLRYYHQSLNLDPENVALYGTSAGAGTSLWLGTRDDMADPGNEDPVLRQSTRVRAVGALHTQATYDLVDWEEILLPITAPFAAALGGTDVATIATAIGEENYLLTVFAATSVDEFLSPQLEDYRAELDMLEWMDAGDAPIFVENWEISYDDLLNVLLHHALHALALKARADEVGLESVVYSRDPAFALEDPSGETLTSFLMGHIL